MELKQTIAAISHHKDLLPPEVQFDLNPQADSALTSKCANGEILKLSFSNNRLILELLFHEDKDEPTNTFCIGARLTSVESPSQSNILERARNIGSVEQIIQNVKLLLSSELTEKGGITILRRDTKMQVLQLGLLAEETNKEPQLRIGLEQLKAARDKPDNLAYALAYEYYRSQ